ncbi:hypothetical protein VSO92_14390 [Myroides pelagicus]|uniref:hypothetical protein n=1 Tax=Myroides pelagicus TaxID=270914 RepID=UPI002DB807A3|nr:hypothetical protein [Myroides pelagicus]MEC4115286.1 hypothetical protein [Myroides pelagicus]
MAKKYIDVLVQGMKDYLGSDNNYTDDELKTIAWGGLHETRAFKLLPTSQKSNFESKYERAVQKGRSNSCD